jgi:hypothetical protein
LLGYQPTEPTPHPDRFAIVDAGEERRRPMTWTRGVLAVLAVAAVGYVATRPDDEAKYLGDFPSIFESAEQAPGTPDDPAPRPQVESFSNVAPPVVPRPEAPAADPGYTGGVRPNQGPGPDTATRFSPPGFEGDNPGAPGSLGLPSLPPPPLCEGEFVRPGVGLISCATGEILARIDPVTGLLIDPVTGLPIELPVETPVG